MTTDEIIKAAGGVSAVAEKTSRIPDAVRRWRFNGIPERHWPEIMGMVPDLTAIELHDANKAARTRDPSEAAA